jgi:hypothetical protein
MGLSFTFAAGPRQHIHSRIRVRWDSRPCFTVLDSRDPFLSPPTTRRATVEIFDPASTREYSRINYMFSNLSLNLILLSTISRPVSLGIKRPSGAYGEIFITVRQLQVCWFGALSLKWGRVCRLQFLLSLASAVILGTQSFGTRDHILRFQNRDFPFRSLVRLAELRWRFLPRLHTGL